MKAHYVIYNCQDHSHSCSGHEVTKFILGLINISSDTILIKNCNLSKLSFPLIMPLIALDRTHRSKYPDKLNLFFSLYVYVYGVSD